jgi:hypothetical protein
MKMESGLSSGNVHTIDGLNVPIEAILRGCCLPPVNEKKNQKAPILSAKTVAILERITSLIISSHTPHPISNPQPPVMWGETTTGAMLLTRKAGQLEALRYIWMVENYDNGSSSASRGGATGLLVAQTMPAAIEQLLSYLSYGNHANLTPDVVALRKKSGTALVTIAKAIPQHLVTFMTELSNRATQLLADPNTLEGTVH